ncbi:hypothetical protein [Komagataeibacter xylinus]|uniref:Uncharacterized protein n=1 Tax=Komagataeibacter xylinus TaxID=28448 RepID=A0A857FTD8_KOMXY|nr:hypothetical protein [Komagataeibacter xylinus]QHC36440.1 hypothetical protein FMA36_13870 [Komagataeibacter xylinus]
MKKRLPIFTQFKVDKGPDANGIALPAVFLFLALSYTALVLFFAWLGGGLIVETPSLHQHAIPPVCARGYRI